MKSNSRNSGLHQENKSVALALGAITPQDTISLTDMLKTNCSHQEISNMARIQGFEKLSKASQGQSN